MRIVAYSFVLATTTLSCTKILGIDGRYVLEGSESGGGEGLGSGGMFEASAETGGDLGSGGTAEGGQSGAPAGSGGIVPISGGGASGRGGAGGRDAGGGTGGGTGGGGADAGGACAPGKKRCPNVGCVTPDPSVGCDLGTDCQACTFPDNSSPICTNAQCDYQCYPGYRRNSTMGTCDPSTSGTGGAGGTGGGPGFPGTPCSKPTPIGSSPECKCVGFPGCCNFTQHCGCLFAVACF